MKKDDKSDEFNQTRPASNKIKIEDILDESLNAKLNEQLSSNQ